MKIIKAVAGVLYQNNQVLMASRPLDKVHAGYWEFPGGKIEISESVPEALVRELKEEIGVIVEPYNCEYLTNISQEYEHGIVQLQVMLCKKWDSEVIALEHQELHWQDLRHTCTLSPLLITTQKILNLLTLNLSKSTYI